MDTVTVSTYDVALLFALVKQLNPDNYDSPDAKAMIYKARSVINNKPKNLRFVP